MTTRSALTQPHSVDYSHLEPLPDPQRESDMQQHEHVLYAGYGVSEYWRFNHTGGRFHDAALAGDVLVDGEYKPAEITRESDGLIWGRSDVLGVDLCWDVQLLQHLRTAEVRQMWPVHAR